MRMRAQVHVLMIGADETLGKLSRACVGHIAVQSGPTYSSISWSPIPNKYSVPEIDLHYACSVEAITEVREEGDERKILGMCLGVTSHYTQASCGQKHDLGVKLEVLKYVFDT